jgi:hypothetical protein
MFSNLTRAKYSDKKAKSQEGLLDILKRSGYSVLWRDNNSSCKGTCDRVDYEAMKDLKIPEKSIKFVGELIQVKTGFQQNRRAIESVLFAISRNLLCDPKYRDDLTKWLDNKGLKADITVKRITEDELVNQHLDLDFTDNQILGQIDVLPKSQHLFTDYLWTWLLNTFDYKLVELSKYRRVSIVYVWGNGSWYNGHGGSIR